MVAGAIAIQLLAKKISFDFGEHRTFFVEAWMIGWLAVLLAPPNVGPPEGWRAARDRCGEGPDGGYRARGGANVNGRRTASRYPPTASLDATADPATSSQAGVVHEPHRSPDQVHRADLRQHPRPGWRVP
jgi:hypothetical protein